MRLWICLFFFGWGAIGPAVENDAQVWSSFIFQGPSDNPTRLFFEVSPRFGDNFSRVQTVLVRPALFYALDEQTTLWAGYAWTPLLSPAYRDEQRLWQQYQRIFISGGHKITFRFRLEERFVGNFPLSLRSRIQGRMTHPFWGTPWEAVAWDELFIHLNTVSGFSETGVDRNRLFLGASYRLHERIQLESGYMMQYVARADADLITHNICLFAMINF